MQNNLKWCKKKLVKFLYSILSRLGVIEKSSPFRRIPPPPPRLDRVNRIKLQLILTLKKARSAKVQATMWIRFKQDDELIELAFNSRMMNVHNLSEINEIVNEIIAHMREQVENPALLNSRSVFDEVLFMDIDFHQLNVMRGSSYVTLPEWLANKKAIINPCNSLLDGRK